MSENNKVKKKITTHYCRTQVKNNDQFAPVEKSF